MAAHYADPPSPAQADVARCGARTGDERDSAPVADRTVSVARYGGTGCSEVGVTVTE